MRKFLGDLCYVYLPFRELLVVMVPRERFTGAGDIFYGVEDSGGGCLKGLSHEIEMG